MNKKISSIFMINFIIIFFSSCAYAQQFTKNGYSIDIKWKQKHNRSLVVWGNVESGKSCKQLNISISFDNTKKSTAIGWVETYIKNYNSQRGASYKVADDVNATLKMKKHWFVDNVYIRCLD